jgi:activating signal cointegrator 1
MKALTLTQPWAQLVAIGAKKIETRSWNTKYRGPLAIHAALGFPSTAQERLFDLEFFKPLRDAGYGTVASMPIGAIVATCELVNVVKVISAEEIPALPERAFGDYSMGRYMWFLDHVEFLPEPISAKGALGLWDFDGDLSMYCSNGYDMNEVDDGRE